MNSKSVDRRILKTQQALHHALISLMREKRYDSILVQEILDRANVGRSTFYTHYRDKDELLLLGIVHLQEFLEQAQASVSVVTKYHYERAIGFSLAMFEHANEHRDVYRSLLGGGGWVIMRQQMNEMLESLVKKELKSYFNNKRTACVPPILLVQFIVSVFLSVLTWWLDQPKPITSRDINEYFRKLVLPTMSIELNL